MEGVGGFGNLPVIQAGWVLFHCTSFCFSPYVPGVRILLRLGSIYVTFYVLIRFLLHYPVCYDHIIYCAKCWNLVLTSLS